MKRSKSDTINKIDFFFDRRQKKIISNTLSKEQQDEAEKGKLTFVRMWVIIMWVLMTLSLTEELLEAYHGVSLVYLIINWSLNGSIFILLICSKMMNIKYVYPSILLLQVMFIAVVFEYPNVLASEYPEHLAIYTVLIYLAILMNTSILSYVFQKFKHVFTVVTVLIINFGIIFRFYDLKNLDEKEYAKKDMIVNACVVTLVMPVYMFFTQAMQ